MPQRVVHALELVHVEKENGERNVVPARHLVQPLLNEEAVRQQGQRIMICDPPRTFLRLFLLGDIADEALENDGTCPLRMHGATAVEDPALLAGASADPVDAGVPFRLSFRRLEHRCKPLEILLADEARPSRRKLCQRRLGIARQLFQPATDEKKW